MQLRRHRFGESTPFVAAADGRGRPPVHTMVERSARPIDVSGLVGVRSPRTRPPSAGLVRLSFWRDAPGSAGSRGRDALLALATPRRYHPGLLRGSPGASTAAWPAPIRTCCCGLGSLFVEPPTARIPLQLYALTGWTSLPGCAVSAADPGPRRRRRPSCRRSTDVSSLVHSGARSRVPGGGPCSCSSARPRWRAVANSSSVPATDPAESLGRPSDSVWRAGSPVGRAVSCLQGGAASVDCA